MKKILILILIISNTAFAQDIIVKKNGEEVKSKIIEITNSEIKFKDFDFQDGPTRNISVNEVFMIIYENGKRETFNNEETVSEKSSSTQVSSKKYKGDYFMAGVGWGNSYGGNGVRAQLRRSIGENSGYGFHAGVGYYPDAPVLASLGAKYFPYRDLYVNAQFGLVGYDYDYDSYRYDEGLMFGPSILVGGDWTWGDKIGFGFNAGIGGTYNISNYGDDLLLAADLGFIVRF